VFLSHSSVSLPVKPHHQNTQSILVINLIDLIIIIIIMDYTEACRWLELDPKHEIEEDMLKRAFRKAAIREHPDKSRHQDATKRFQSVKRAHELLDSCVERGETGPYADLERTDDHGKDDKGGDYDVDIVDHFMAHVYFSHLQHQMHHHMGGGGFGVGVGGPRVYYEDDDDDDYYDEDDDSYDYDYDHDSEDEHDRYTEMERRRQQAMKEGRGFFESWSVKQLQQEAARRGFSTKGLQQDSLVELLIEDEAKKQKKRELKKKAPLIDEWVEIVGLTSQPHLNGMKAKAIDFCDGKYTCGNQELYIVIF
jgi:curved DNA-binding protein CbpA